MSTPESKLIAEVFASLSDRLDRQYAETAALKHCLSQHVASATGKPEEIVRKEIEEQCQQHVALYLSAKQDQSPAMMRDLNRWREGKVD